MLPPARFITCIVLCCLIYFPASSYGQDFKQSDVLGYTSFKGPHDSPEEMLTLLERQARWDDAGAGDRNLTGARFNPSGLRLRFEKIVGQAAAIGHMTARYRVFAEGAPENKVFAFDAWQVDKTVRTDPRDIYVNSQGLLMVHMPKPGQETSLEAGSDELEIGVEAATAEPARYLLSSKDNELMIYGTLVPHPVVTVDRGCRLEARLARLDAAAVLILADWFPAKARIPLVLESGDLTLRKTMIADADGHAVMAVFPYVPGKTEGMLKATAEGHGCLPAVLLPWGPARTEPH